MTILKSTVDIEAADVAANRDAMLAKLAEIEAEHAKAIAGGGTRYVTRHHKRGKLLPRERIELLLDPDSPFLELSPLAAWGSEYAVGASLVTGIGVVEGVECLITANDQTVRGGAGRPWSRWRPARRATTSPWAAPRCTRACRVSPTPSPSTNRTHCARPAGWSA